MKHESNFKTAVDPGAYAQGYRDFPVVNETVAESEAYRMGFLDAEKLARVEQLRAELLERTELLSGGALHRRVGFAG